MRALKFLIPLAVFMAIAVFLYRGLSLDPRKLPSPLIDKPAPAFVLPQLHTDGQSWTPEAMRGKVWMLNVWGSWCAACVQEHPLLNQLSAGKVVPIVGLAWKDKPEDSKRWLQRYGDPFVMVVYDQKGGTPINYGVYGAPETFVIDKRGIIRHKQVGPFTAEIIRDELVPLIERLNGEPV